MNYYVHRSGEVLEHALRERGAERANHKYVTRINVGGRYRYFYTPEELAAYRAGKKVGRKKAESQSVETTKRKPKSGIRVIRKDGTSYRVKPISTKASSSETGRQILERLLSGKRRKKRKNASAKAKSNTRLKLVNEDGSRYKVRPKPSKPKTDTRLKVINEDGTRYRVRSKSTKLKSDNRIKVVNVDRSSYKVQPTSKTRKTRKAR